MNRINRIHRKTIINYTRCKEIYFNSQNFITRLLYHKSIREVCIWCAIRDTIRKGYKKAIE